ncbi:uncharacterized protein N7506_009669 [Penicillium brevicompactum]|uniref:uncharacterized protein n=1 Tax=Penicillium brevicompactum TaxID=5074 RepID=UPI002541E506|nr:uncharacterized protein N7506_009669 [Penicillium brevicompactum]KAJ5326567.1 hypothetical protein N7506_009669 [Penicillium brevicompactum]
MFTVKVFNILRPEVRRVHRGLHGLRGLHVLQVRPGDHLGHRDRQSLGDHPDDLPGRLEDLQSQDRLGGHRGLQILQDHRDHRYVVEEGHPGGLQSRGRQDRLGCPGEEGPAGRGGRASLRGGGGIDPWLMRCEGW